MKEKNYPKHININKSNFDCIGEDDYYDDVLVWVGAANSQDCISYTRSDLVPQWKDPSKELPKEGDDIIFIPMVGLGLIHPGYLLRDAPNGRVWFQSCLHDTCYDIDGVLRWMPIPPLKAEDNEQD